MSDSGSEIELGPGDRETDGSPTPPPRHIGIHSAIEAAPALLLKEIVHYFWRELPQSHSIIDGSLRLPLGGSKGSSSSSSLKRKANEECKNCGFLYAVDENKHGKCRYHCGEQEVDEDSKVWASYNPERDGEKLGDSLVNNDFYADGYVMKCCERKPYEPGCVISRHKPVDPERPRKVKRGLDMAGLW